MPPTLLSRRAGFSATAGASSGIANCFKLVSSRLRQAFALVDVAIGSLPVVGPLASLVLRLAMLLALVTMVRRVVLIRPLHRALGRRQDYLPGRHIWASAPVALPPNFCNVCGKATTGFGDVIARCEVCGCYAHSLCTRKAGKAGLLCKATFRQDMEAASATPGNGGATPGERVGVRARISRARPRSFPKLRRPSSSGAETTAPATALSTAVTAANNAENAEKSAENAGKSAENADNVRSGAAAAEDTPPVIMRHQWLRGNIDQLRTCAECGQFCGSDGLFGLHGYACVWCGVQVHEACLQPMLGEHCSLGRHRQLILPPTAVQRLGRASKKQLLIDGAASLVKRVMPHGDGGGGSNATAAAAGEEEGEGPHSFFDDEWADSLQEGSPQQRGATGGGVNDVEYEDEEDDEDGSKEASGQALVSSAATEGDAPAKSARPRAAGGAARFNITVELIPPDVSPLLVFVNSRSGGRQGAALLSRFRALLNPLQVVDLSREDPAAVLSRFRDVPRLRLLCCGGDGTVAWVLKAVDGVSWPVEPPPMAIMPLGTGNDLARILGWGGGETQDPADVLDRVQTSQVALMDRWSVTATPLNAKGRHERELVMNNYLGIGVDGQVALDFHRMRENYGKLFVNRIINKIWYAQLGTMEFFSRRHKNLPEKLELFCDGEQVKLPPSSESLIVLNIDSYAGGSKMWSIEEKDGGPDDWSLPAAARRAGSGTATSSAARTWWRFGEPEPRREQFYQKTGKSSASSGGSSASSGESSASSGESSASLEGAEDVRGNRRNFGQNKYGRRAGGGGGGGGSGGGKTAGGYGRNGAVNGFNGVAAAGPRPAVSSISDGLLEVVAVAGVLHLGQIQVGLSQAYTVAQSGDVLIRTAAPLPMQVDGEPWQQPPSEVRLRRHDQAAMLRPVSKEEETTAAVLQDVLRTAERKGVLTRGQAREVVAILNRRATRST